MNIVRWKGWFLHILLFFNLFFFLWIIGHWWIGKEEKCRNVILACGCNKWHCLSFIQKSRVQNHSKAMWSHLSRIYNLTQFTWWCNKGKKSLFNVQASSHKPNMAWIRWEYRKGTKYIRISNLNNPPTQSHKRYIHQQTLNNNIETCLSSVTSSHFNNVYWLHQYYILSLILGCILHSLFLSYIIHAFCHNVILFQVLISTI